MTNVLVWSEKEQGWICGECGAVYSDAEVARMFGYNDGREPENFECGYCMDCGVHFTTIVKTEN